MKYLSLICSLIPVFSSINASESMQNNPQLDIRIPIVSMKDYYDAEKKNQFLDTLFEAMTTVGFFAVKDTGVNPQVLEEAYNQSKEFFEQSSDYKMKSYVTETRGQRGYVPGETAKGIASKDIKEFYHTGRKTQQPANIWPEQVGFKEVISNIFDELDRYSVPLQQAIIEAINKKSGKSLPLDLLSSTSQNGNSLLRAIHYPAMKQEQLGQEGICWGAAHTDIDYLAILPYATEKGLQVQIDGQWLNVVVPDDSFIVNVGDMLENLTNGLFVSARHRVMALEPEKDRFSMVLFVHPTDDTQLDPLAACIELTGGVKKYAPGTRMEFLWERLLELGIAPGLLPTYAKTGHVERQVQFGRESPQVVEMLINEGLASQELLKALEDKRALSISTSAR